MRYETTNEYFKRNPGKTLDKNKGKKTKQK